MGSPTGKQLQRIPAQDNLYFRRMTLSGDGKWCLSDPEHEAKMLPDARFVVATLRLWNLQRGKEARSFKLVKTRAQLIWELAWQYVDYFIEGKGGDSIRATAISHDGKWVAGGTDRHEVHLWDAATGKKAHVLGRSNNEMEFPAAFSRDGKWLATHTFTLARFRKGEIFPITGVWDVTTGKEKHRIEGTLFDTCFSDDGKWLISGYKENTGTVWDVKTGKQIRTFGGHKKPVTYCSLSSDKKRLVTYDESDTNRVWDAATAKELRAFKVRGWPDSLWHQVQFRMRMSRNAKMMVTWTPTHLRLWDLTTGKTIRSMERLLKL